MNHIKFHIILLNLFFIALFFLPDWAFSQTTTLLTDSVLTEYRIGARTLTIDLQEEEFKNYATMQISDFTLVNNPTGLNIKSVQGISPIQAKLDLQFDGTDFDTDISDFRVDISYTILVETSSGVLSSNQLGRRLLKLKY